MTSRVRIFRSLTALAEASDAVAVSRVTDMARSEDVGGTPVTITTIEILEVLRGEVAPTVELRQMGGLGQRIPMTLAIVEAFNLYAVMLVREPRLAPKGRPQYWPAWASGLFAINGDQVTHLDPESELDYKVVNLQRLRCLISE